MPKKIERYRTSRFVEWSPLIALGALGLMGIAVIVAPFFLRQLLKTKVAVLPGETVQLDPIQPRQSPIGAVRIDAIAQLPTNTWSTFEVQVLDSQGNILASAIKQAWQESGTWEEDGESGTWSEQDLSGRFDIRQATLDAPIVVAISVLEQGTVNNQPLNESVTFQVTVWDGAIDHRFVWSGFVGVLLLTVLAAIATKNGGEIVITKTVKDSDPRGRGRLGNPDKLVRVAVRIVGDETSPRKMKADLAIKDSYGKVIYRCSRPIQFYFRGEERVLGYCALDLILEAAASYGFSVDIVPDAPIDWTYLTVREGARTLVPTEIVHIRT